MKTCKHATCKDECRRPKPVKRRTSVRKISPKQIEILKRYKALRIAFLKANPVCVVTGKPATEVHHSAGRMGRLMLATEYWKPVSREGHIWIEEHPLEAKEKGFSVSRLDK